MYGTHISLKGTLESRLNLVKEFPIDNYQFLYGSSYGVKFVDRGIKKSLKQLNRKMVIHAPCSFKISKKPTELVELLDVGAYLDAPVIIHSENIDSYSFLDKKSRYSALNTGDISKRVLLIENKASEIFRPERWDRCQIQYCLDTCHLWASMNPLPENAKTPQFEALYDQVARYMDKCEIKVFHLNDSKDPMGSKKDHHQKLTEGTIFDEVNLSELYDLISDKMVITETPYDDLKEHVYRERKLLRGSK